MTDNTQASPPQPPALAQPLPQYAVPYSATQTNSLAIISFVASLVGLFMLPIVGSIVGIVLGHQARQQIAVRGESGGGLATAGIVIGWVTIALWVLGLVAWVALWFLLLAGAAVS